MPFVAYEDAESRSVNIAFDKQSAVLTYVGFRSTDDAVARAGFIAAIPLVFQNLLFQNFECNHLGGGLWEATANYSSEVTISNPGQGGASPPPPPPPAPGGNDPLSAGFQFDISVETETIRQAKETISKTGRNGAVAPATFGAIGATDDGQVTGVEKYKPRLEWSTTRTLEFVTLNYVRTFETIVGSVNDDTFYGFAAGEVMCMGISGNSKDLQTLEMTYKFAVQRNRTDIVIVPPGDTDSGLTVASKDGWHILDVKYKNVANSDGSIQMTMQPFAAYVYRIYDEVDFAVLGIST